MKLQTGSIQNTPIQAITELCFLETEDELNSVRHFDACIVCGSNDPSMMDVVAMLFAEERLTGNIIISGHQAPTALTEDQVTIYEKLLPAYNAVISSAHELGIPEAELVSPFLKKLNATKKTLEIRKFDKPEYLVYMKRGIELGIPESAMILETSATNAKENIDYSMKLIKEDIGFESINNILIVAKGFMTRRVEMSLRAYEDLPGHVNYVFLPYASSTKAHSIHRKNWYEDTIATRRVLEEVIRIGQYAVNGDLKLQ